MGRKKKPTRLHLVHGTDRKDRINTAEPEVEPVSELVAPSWFSAEQRAEWDLYLAELVAMRVIARADSAVLASFCIAVACLKDCEKLIDVNGLVIDGDNGPKKNPAITIGDEAMRMIRLLGADLGLTPASRPGLQANPPPDNSEKARAARRLLKPG